MSYKKKLYRKPKTTFKAQQMFSEYRAASETIWKNVVKPDRPQTTKYYGACPFQAE
jgi:hypothetical protein